MSDEKTETAPSGEKEIVIETRAQAKLKKFFSRLFMLVITVALFFVWILVAMQKTDFKYAMWVSIGVIGAWLVVAIGNAIIQRGIIKSERTGKEYKAEPFGVLSLASEEETSDAAGGIGETPNAISSEAELNADEQSGTV